MKRTSLKSYLIVTFLLGAFAACGNGPEPGSDLDAFPDPTEECKKDEDCSEAAPICDELAGCVACQFDKDCAEGQRCHERECIAKVPCTSSQECTTAQPICDGSQGVCVVCLKDPDCGPDARCVSEACEEVEACVNSRDCAEGTVCDLGRSYCVDCVADLDCGEEQVCVENTCQAKCVSDKDCVSEGLLCDRDAAHCVECLRDVDCPDVYHCAGGKCTADLCPSGEAACDDIASIGSRQAVFTCNENGSGYAVDTCSSSSTCLQSGDFAQCQPWVCYPGAAECADTNNLSVCAADGLSATKVDCSKMGGACEPGPDACVDVVCAPNQYSCESGVSMVCNARGTGLSLAESCPETSYCSEATGRCEPDACTAEAAVCDGNVVMKCAVDGSGYAKAEDCEKSDALCRDGLCRPVICKGSLTYDCLNGDVYECVDSWARKLAVDCTETQICYDEGVLASCLDIACDAGEPTCIGSTAGTCNETGLWLEEGAVDCDKTDQTCFEGECRDIVCEGTNFCDEDGNVRACIDNGSATGEVVVDCLDAQYCAQGSRTASCRTDVCGTGERSCRGKDVAVCNADGSGFVLSEECPTDQTCVLGTCLPVICEANAYYCLNGNLYLCGADGTTNQLRDTCLASEYCQAGATTCRPDVCTAGSAICNGANLAVCAADGSGPVDAGTPCDLGEVCAAGACAEVLCEAGSYRCFENVRQTCNATGTSWGSALTCSAAQFCDESPLPSAPVCTTDFCVAGEPTCDGETLATCGPYGGSFSAQGTDCSLTDQVCNKSACVDVEELTLAESASTSSTSTTRTYLNRFFVRTPRQLTEIEQYFTTSGTSQFTFYVYRSLSPTGSFERVVEKLITASASGSYVSSGALDLTLEAGYYYAIGVRTSGSYSYSALSSGDTFESFARVDGGYQTTTTPGATLSISKSTIIHRQRLSLEPVP